MAVSGSVDLMVTAGTALVSPYQKKYSVCFLTGKSTLQSPWFLSAKRRCLARSYSSLCGHHVGHMTRATLALDRFKHLARCLNLKYKCIPFGRKWMCFSPSKRGCSSLVTPTCPREQSPTRDLECAVAEHFYPSAVLSAHHNIIPVQVPQHMRKMDTC